jgi:ABC-type bacteriocin/lantibiotic exporter with double-glycine peptidase domain
MRLHVPHWRQRQQGECLAACAAMVLLYLGERLNYDRLVQRLGTSSAGAFFFNLARLRSWRVAVEWAQGTLDLLQVQLAAGQPVIVPVDTGLLPYWLTRADIPDAERVTDHAVVVVGIDAQYVYVNDPDLEIVPQRVEREWFHDAWRNREQWYAVIHHRWLWRLTRLTR